MKALCVLVLAILFIATGCQNGDSEDIDVYGGSTDIADIPKHIADFKDESNSGLVQARAMNALVKIGKPAVPPLIAALESEDSSTRLMALNTLNLMGADAKEAIPTIEKLTKDDDTDVQKRAIDVLANLQKQ
jgi:HEAT repeat protein